MVMGRNECGSNAMVTVQMTVEEYLEMKSSRKSPSVPPFSKEVKSKNDPLVMSALLSVMLDPIGHPSLAEFINELLRLRIFLVIHPHHLLNSVGNPRACLRMVFDSPDTERLQLKMKFSGYPKSPSFHLLRFCLWNILYRDLSLTATAESLFFNDARKSSNCPICKCVFGLIWKYTNALACVCAYVLMHVCSCLLMNLCTYVLMYVAMYILMCECVNLSMFQYACVPMC